MKEKTSSFERGMHIQQTARIEGKTNNVKKTEIVKLRKKNQGKM